MKSIRKLYIALIVILGIMLVIFTLRIGEMFGWFAGVAVIVGALVGAAILDDVLLMIEHSNQADENEPPIAEVEHLTAEEVQEILEIIREREKFEEGYGDQNIGDIE